MEEYKKEVKKILRKADPFKKITNQLKKDIKIIEKPWGHYKQYCLNRKCTARILSLNKGQKLNKQSHNSIDKLWIILDDGIIIEVNEKIIHTKKGEEILIPKGAKHRAYAFNSSGKIMEISFGKFDEADLTAYE